jgi:hypothetical protein
VVLSFLNEKPWFTRTILVLLIRVFVTVSPTKFQLRLSLQTHQFKEQQQGLCNAFCRVNPSPEDHMTIRVFQHNAAIRQIHNLESGLCCPLLSSAGDMWWLASSSCEQCGPGVLGACWAHGGREVVRVPWWGAVEVSIEEVFHIQSVAKALSIDGDFGEELHHTVDDDPASESTFVCVHLMVLGFFFVAQKGFAKGRDCVVELACVYIKLI